MNHGVAVHDKNTEKKSNNQYNAVVSNLRVRLTLVTEETDEQPLR